MGRLGPPGVEEGPELRGLVRGRLHDDVSVLDKGLSRVNPVG